MVNSRLPAPHRAPRLDPAGWQQRLTSVPGRELLAPATGAPNVQIWVFNAVIVIKPASMQNGGYFSPGRELGRIRNVNGQRRHSCAKRRIFAPDPLSDPGCDDAPIIPFGAHRFLPGRPAGIGCRGAVPLVLGLCRLLFDLRAGGSKLSWAGPVGVFEGAVEAAEVAESAAERDRCDGPADVTGIEEFAA